MHRRTFLLGALATAAVGACGRSTSEQTAPRRDEPPQRQYGDVRLTRQRPRADAPHVLFISLDDCNDWLGFLNAHPGTSTPNLDALAAESLVFDHAYTAAPMCLPSRSAVMFGLPPHVSGIYDHSDASTATYKQMAERTPSLVDAFWAAGYFTAGAGKIFHDPQKQRWSKLESGREKVAELRYDPDWLSPFDGKPLGKGGGGPVDFGSSGRPPEQEIDHLDAQWVIDVLRGVDRPSFVGYGTYFPHAPWRIPQRFLDLHPLEEVVVPTPPADDLADLGPYARDKIIDRHGHAAKVAEADLWRPLVQAYQAALSFADDCVGQVLDALYSGPHADDTIVAVWSDHGYHLNEKLHLHKFTLWERATHVPLLLRVPGRFDSGQRFDPPVSLLDLGPTLLELCGIDPLPQDQGQSLLAVVDDPTRADDRPAVMTWLEGNHAVRRGPWRYIRYRTGEIELYDHRVDPDELTNLAADPAHREVIDQLDPYLPAPS